MTRARVVLAFLVAPLMTPLFFSVLSYAKGTVQIIYPVGDSLLTQQPRCLVFQHISSNDYEATSNVIAARSLSRFPASLGGVSG